MLARSASQAQPLYSICSVLLGFQFVPAVPFLLHFLCWLPVTVICPSVIGPHTVEKGFHWIFVLYRSRYESDQICWYSLLPSREGGICVF
jgi:hypothetical protein